MERKNDWYLRWKEKYYNRKIVDLKKHLTEYDFELLKKLGIKIDKNKIYTEYEFEILDMELIKFYKDNDMTLKELEMCEDLDSVGVTRDDYDYLIDKISSIKKIYNF